MAKVTFKNTSIKFNTGDFLGDKKEQQRVARAVRSESITNFRAGKGANDKDFPGLKSSSIKNREYISINNSTHRAYRVNKSNITISGRFVQSFKVKFQKFGRKNKQAVYGLAFTGKHKRYKSLKNKPIGKSPSNNSDIADNLTSLGNDLSGIPRKAYDLYGIPRKAKDRIVKNYRAWIRRNLRVKK